MKLPHLLNKQATEALETIPEAHRLGIQLVVNALCTIGGSVSPQSALVPVIQQSFSSNSLPVIDSKRLTEYIRKYESLGFFKRTVNRTDKRQNILSVTDLGRSLVATFERDQAAAKTPTKIVWVERTKWKLETALRQRRSFIKGTAVPLKNLAAEVIAKKALFGLYRLTNPATAEQFIRDVIRSRFGADELKIDEATSMLHVLKSLR